MRFIIKHKKIEIFKKFHAHEIKGKKMYHKVIFQISDFEIKKIQIERCTVNIGEKQVKMKKCGSLNTNYSQSCKIKYYI